jgi:hypothetical protein
MQVSFGVEKTDRSGEHNCLTVAAERAHSGGTGGADASFPSACGLPLSCQCLVAHLRAHLPGAALARAAMDRAGALFVGGGVPGAGLAAVEGDQPCDDDGSIDPHPGIHGTHKSREREAVKSIERKSVKSCLLPSGLQGVELPVFVVPSATPRTGEGAPGITRGNGGVEGV